jgi:hypothetical protein
MRLKLLAGLSCVLGLAAAPSVACPLPPDDGGNIVRSNLHDVAVKTVPADVQVGQPFEVSLIACNKDGSAFDGELKANATMPAHKHGMNYTPVFVTKGNGTYHGTGFLFHMPGKWQYVFDLRRGDQSSSIKLDHMLK